MKPIRIGTDCSGIEAPVYALRKMKIPFSHEFSCEIDKNARRSILANYSPKVMYEDIFKRNVKDLPDIDMYVCGFPCQPFSLAGNREGMNIKNGQIFFECLQVIKTKRPKIFVLENVKGLLSANEGETFKMIISSLKKIKGYFVDYKVLNTKDYGIPQNRERVFIVGMLKKEMINEFKWPEHKKMKSLLSFIDRSDTHTDMLPERVRDAVEKSNAVLVDLKFVLIRDYLITEYSPTIHTQGDLWCTKMHRKTNVNELLSLQGFRKFKQVVSDNQMKKQIGNSMSVNVLECLFNEVFKSI